MGRASKKRVASVSAGSSALARAALVAAHLAVLAALLQAWRESSPASQGVIATTGQGLLAAQAVLLAWAVARTFLPTLLVLAWIASLSALAAAVQPFFAGPVGGAWLAAAMIAAAWSARQSSALVRQEKPWGAWQCSLGQLLTATTVVALVAAALSQGWLADWIDGNVDAALVFLPVVGLGAGLGLAGALTIALVEAATASTGRQHRPLWLAAGLMGACWLLGCTGCQLSDLSPLTPTVAVLAVGLSVLAWRACSPSEENARR